MLHVTICAKAFPIFGVVIDTPFWVLIYRRPHHILTYSIQKVYGLLIRHHVMRPTICQKQIIRLKFTTVPSVSWEPFTDLLGQADFKLRHTKSGKITKDTVYINYTCTLLSMYAEWYSWHKGGKGDNFLDVRPSELGNYIGSIFGVSQCIDLIM